MNRALLMLVLLSATGCAGGGTLDGPADSCRDPEQALAVVCATDSPAADAPLPERDGRLEDPRAVARAVARLDTMVSRDGWIRSEADFPYGFVVEYRPPCPSQTGVSYEHRVVFDDTGEGGDLQWVAALDFDCEAG